MKKRVLIFSLAYYPSFIGGAEIAIKEITDRISSDEIEFDMITIGKYSNSFEKIGNINVYRVGSLIGDNKRNSKISLISKLSFPFLAFLKANKLNKKNNYNLIWSMMASYAGFAGFLFKKLNKTIPFLLSIQEGDNFKRREGAFNYFFKLIFSNPDRVQVISNFLELWVRHMGARCPVDIIPNGVDIELFYNKNYEKKKTDDIVLITTSRLVVKNATGDTIDSLTYLPDKVKLKILGQGYQEKELKEKVSKLKLEKRVQFLGYVPHREMPKYLHDSDIFIRPALSEGFGNSFIEAMASGIPVIATPVGGIVDFLRDGETGIFCEVNNPKSIAQKVEKLIKDKESRDYIVNNALDMVKKKYDWNIIANDMKNKVFLRML